MPWTDRKMREQIAHFFHNLMRQRGSSSVGAAGTEAGERPGTEYGMQTSGQLETVGTESYGPEIAGQPEPAGDPGVEDGGRRNDTRAGRNSLADRKEFERVVNRSLCDSQFSGCLLIADVDRFREINDIYGQDTGDAVLRNVVDTLGGCLSDHECIVRQGGDTFAVWLPLVSTEGAQTLRRQTGMVNDRLMHPYEELPPVSLSVGAAFGEPGDDCRSLGRKAVKALNRVKESGRCGCEIYENRN